MIPSPVQFSPRKTHKTLQFEGFWLSPYSGLHEQLTKKEPGLLCLGCLVRTCSVDENSLDGFPFDLVGGKHPGQI